MTTIKNRDARLAILLYFETMQEAAKAMGITGAALSQVLHGHRRPTINERAAFQRVFGEVGVRRFFPPEVNAETESLKGF